jgi:hypothetical protein
VPPASVVWVFADTGEEFSGFFKEVELLRHPVTIMTLNRFL